MKKKFKWILIVGIILASTAAYGVVLLAPASAEAELVKASDLVHSFSVQGELVPENSVILNSAVAGRVTNIPCKPGMELAAGTVLLETDGAVDLSVTLQKEQIVQQLAAARQTYDRLYGANGSAASELAAAKSRYSLANKEYENGRILAEQGGFLSQSDLSALKSARDIAYEQLKQAEENESETSRMYYKEQVTSLENQLAALSTTISPGNVMMPYDGVVWELYAQNGAVLAQNQMVAKVYEKGAMKLEASVLSEDAAYLKEGQTAEVVYADGSGDQAAVTFLSRVSNRQLSSVGMEENRSTAELMPQALPKMAGAGQKADITFHVIVDSGVLTVPSAAIIPGAEGDVVYLISAGKAVPSAVETGRKESGRVEILSGIEEGDVIAADPYNDKLKTGSRVKPFYSE